MRRAVEKCPTYIRGFDALAGGGLPRGRPTLVVGNAGCGKTLFGSEFLGRGAEQGGEPGVLFSFEEREQDLAENLASIGIDVPGLVERNLLRVEEVHIEPESIAETGDYDLEGLFIRIGHAVDEIGARRVVLDTIEALFAGFPNHRIIRSELNRLFRWLKDRDLTAVITAERGTGDSLSRFGIEEYVSDCVVTLDNRVVDQVSTRRLRVLKYRGSAHGTNEYPFLISDSGFLVLPITNVDLSHSASRERASTGVEALDAMLGGGYYRGSSVLITGTPGTGKSSLGLAAALAACEAGGRALVLSFEESPSEIERNMASIGFDLAPLVESEQLVIQSTRPTSLGLEQHLIETFLLLDELQPGVVVVDPVSSLLGAGELVDVSRLLIRLTDELKAKQVTTIFTYLTSPGRDGTTEEGLSSLADAWIRLELTEEGRRRSRRLSILKSRGMDHELDYRRLRFSSDGLEVNAMPDGSEEEGS